MTTLCAVEEVVDPGGGDRQRVYSDDLGIEILRQRPRPTGCVIGFVGAVNAHDDLPARRLLPELVLDGDP